MPYNMINALTAECPQCSAEVAFNKTPRLRQKTNCPSCRTKLEVVFLRPIMLDWAGPMPQQD